MPGAFESDQEKAHCLTGNLVLSASIPPSPPTLPWPFLQGCNVAHQPWRSRSTWHTLKRMKKMFHEATRGRSLSPQHTDRLLSFPEEGGVELSLRVQATWE